MISKYYITGILCDYRACDCGGGFLKNEDTAPTKRIRYGVGDRVGGVGRYDSTVSVKRVGGDS